MPDTGTNLQRAIRLITKELAQRFEVDPEDLLALVLMTEPVQATIGRQAQIIHGLLQNGDEERSGE